MSLYKLISPVGFRELLQKETARRVIPVDSTWFLPHLHRDGRREFLEVERIPHAVYFDLDSVKDVESAYPHMVPDLSTFNKSMQELGLKREDILVVYDRVGNFSAPRCAWTLALFGHPTIYLLNSFTTYKNQRFPIDTTEKTRLSDLPPNDAYQSDVDLTANQVISYEEMLEMVKSGELSSKYNVYDARAFGRFKGEDPEPRPEISSGHIPGAQPLPFTELLDSQDKTFAEDAETCRSRLQTAMAKTGAHYDDQKPTIVMCGTGITSVIIKTALEQAGVDNIKVYDGSWTEWVLRSDPRYISKAKDW